MVKEMFERDVEKRPLTSSKDEGTLRTTHLTKGFLGQLFLMGIFTFLMWMVLFSLGGFFPLQANVTLSVCDSPRQINQAILNPVIEQTEIYVANIVADNLKNMTLAIETSSAETEASEEAEESSSEDILDFVQSEPIIPTLVISDENITDALITAFLKYDPNSPSSMDKYYISSSEETLNWFEALQQCMLVEMQLVALDSVEKFQEILERMDVLGLPDGDFWTSGTNLWTDNRNDYFWASTGESFTFMDWLEMEGEKDSEKNNCVQITRSLNNHSEDAYNYRWSDNGCHIKNRFICERF